MYKNHPLKSRIVTAFTIQTLFMAVIAYSTIVSYVDYLEESLLYDHFSEYLDTYVSELGKERNHIIPDDIKIYIKGVMKFHHLFLNRKMVNMKLFYQMVMPTILLEKYIRVQSIYWLKIRQISNRMKSGLIS